MIFFAYALGRYLTEERADLDGTFPRVLSRSLSVLVLYATLNSDPALCYAPQNSFLQVVKIPQAVLLPSQTIAHWNKFHPLASLGLRYHSAICSHCHR